MTSAVESVIKVINQRVKGSEKFWSEPGAEAILQLRADYMSETEIMSGFWAAREAQASGGRPLPSSLAEHSSIQRMSCARSAAAITSGLLPTVLFAVGGRPVALTGMPAPPASGGMLAGRATVACLGPLGQEPTFTSFEQATSAAGVPPARAGQGAG